MSIRARMGVGWRIFWAIFTIAVFLGGGFVIYEVGKRAGFITGTTDTFCEGCDRLRVASDGTLRPCLATERDCLQYYKIKSKVQRSDTLPTGYLMARPEELHLRDR